MRKFICNTIPGFVTTYSICHALIDCACIFFVLGVLQYSSEIILLYNVLAFGLQLPFGIIFDKLYIPQKMAILGLSLVLISFFLITTPYIAVVIIGIGNALFHIGGGGGILQMQKYTARYSGIFVAPGGVGLAIGMFLSKIANYYSYYILIGILCLSIGMLFFVQTPQRNKIQNKIPISFVLIGAIFLIWVTIIIRSFVSTHLHFEWKSDTNWYIAFVLAVALGKILGGFLLEILGFIKVGVGGLIISLLLFYLGNTFFICGIVGFVFFNFTMTVTLISIFSLVPGRAGISFGLTTVALLLGHYIPIGWIDSHVLMFVSIFMSVILLFVGLIMRNKIISKFP